MGELSQISTYLVWYTMEHAEISECMSEKGDRRGSE